MHASALHGAASNYSTAVHPVRFVRRSHVTFACTRRPETVPRSICPPRSREQSTRGGGSIPYYMYAYPTLSRIAISAPREGCTGPSNLEGRAQHSRRAHARCLQWPHPPSRGRCLPMPNRPHASRTKQLRGFFLSDLYNDKHTVVKRAVRSSLFYTQLHQALTQSRETLSTTQTLFFLD